ncbi:MAG TPA: UDP-N-acetylmuramoyl-L-alanyl-D-glutamate--2,6-diaminopimelate ligase, partial [Synergistetes bacterium]|nr:UDP-N-acetylmuramoyl-L-alanyl-D-glutamate--2,6-diaminopimelate ligase [Synergistota bacterium]
MNIRELADILEFNGALRQIIQPSLPCVGGNGGSCEPTITEITHDSRKVVPGSLFACIRGGEQDGHSFAVDAKNRGACGLMCEEDTGENIVHLVVDDVRKRIGEVASAVFGNPSSKLKMFAVTGTNGKSTTAFMLRSIMDSAGEKVGIMGTIFYDDGSGIAVDADRTTPEASDIQRMLALMSQNGCRSCVMEASSHGLSQQRVSGCLFDGCVFTNLSPEHLDFHGTMGNYFASKVKLFRDHMKGSDWKGVANGDDPYGRRIREMFPGNVALFGLEKANNPDFLGKIKRMDLEGIEMTVSGPFGESPMDLVLPVTGAFNARNALGAAALSLMMGLPPGTVRKGLEKLPQVPGRLQRISLPDGVTALIDYAHTPDALY